MIVNKSNRFNANLRGANDKWGQDNDDKYNDNADSNDFNNGVNDKNGGQ